MLPYYSEQLVIALLLSPLHLATWKSLPCSPADGYSQESSAGFLDSSQMQAAKALWPGNSPGSASPHSLAQLGIFWDSPERGSPAHPKRPAPHGPYSEASWDASPSSPLPHSMPLASMKGHRKLKLLNKNKNKKHPKPPDFGP